MSHVDELDAAYGMLALTSYNSQMAAAQAVAVATLKDIAVLNAQRAAAVYEAAMQHMGAVTSACVCGMATYAQMLEAGAALDAAYLKWLAAANLC